MADGIGSAFATMRAGIGAAGAAFARAAGGSAGGRERRVGSVPGPSASAGTPSFRSGHCEATGATWAGRARGSARPEKNENAPAVKPASAVPPSRMPAARNRRDRARPERSGTGFGRVSDGWIATDMRLASCTL
ncbi:hypothetical protein ACFQWF_10105 [Methylorubrum suomiense]